MSSNAFAPQGNTAWLAATTSSTTTPIQVKGNLANATQRLISNLGTVTAYIAAGASDVAAVIPAAGTPANGIAIPAGAILCLTFPPNVYFAVITASGSTTISITPGEGN